LDYLPYPILHKKWQWYLQEMLKEEIGTGEIRGLVDKCYERYPKGFVANVQKGDVPSRYRSLAKYLAKYVVSADINQENRCIRWREGDIPLSFSQDGSRGTGECGRANVYR